MGRIGTGRLDQVGKIVLQIAPFYEAVEPETWNSVGLPEVTAVWFGDAQIEASLEIIHEQLES